MADTEEIFFIWSPSAKESATSRIAAAIVPIVIKGVRLPCRLLHLSEIAPNNGSIKRASTLSSAMIMPEYAWFMPNLSVRIFGIMVS